MNLKSLSKLSTAIAAKKRIEQSRYQALRQSQADLENAASDLYSEERRMPDKDDRSESGVHLRNYGDYLNHLSVRALEKSKAARYLDTLIETQRGVLHSALHKETAVERLTERAIREFKVEQLNKDEEALESVRLTKKPR